MYSIVDTMLHARIIKISVTQSLASGNSDYGQEDRKTPK